MENLIENFKLSTEELRLTPDWHIFIDVFALLLHILVQLKTSTWNRLWSTRPH